MEEESVYRAATSLKTYLVLHCLIVLLVQMLLKSWGCPAFIFERNIGRLCACSDQFVSVLLVPAWLFAMAEKKLEKALRKEEYLFDPEETSCGDIVLS